MFAAIGTDEIKAAERDPELDSYQRDIAGLILAWHIKQNYMSREANPLKCAALLRVKVSY
ncbi:hypothetical protein GZ77_03435 [Endozoicomonas montiporae]|uniref:Uncharacterized protein n=1 Tax=Endozoicomonas montiporae TaxID=1027273 RepID=A0A081NB27_9GAMM|nr:hypothetical protein [Endozoicomonas montiporae]KEQ15650.1 hypothetical protein GZ77_03435 [Endozoicomonas montiporae]